MDRSDFRDAVLAQPDFRSQWAAAMTHIRRSLLTDDDARGAADGTCAKARALQALHRDIMSLLAPMVPPNTRDPIGFIEQRLALTAKASNIWMAELRRFRYAMRHRVMRRDFREERLGAAALRDADHESLRLTPEQPQSIALPDGTCRDYAQVAPYLDSHVSRRARAAAYRRWVRPGRIEADQLRSPHEAALLGQRGVFAVKDIPAGTCIGAYVGQLMNKTETFLAVDDRYLMSVRCSTPGTYRINGEGLMSLLNTLFEYDELGQPTGHPKSGYDLETAVFPVGLPNGLSIGMPAFFTTHDIPAGRELRWNYGLGQC